MAGGFRKGGHFDRKHKGPYLPIEDAMRVGNNMQNFRYMTDEMARRGMIDPQLYWEKGMIQPTDTRTQEQREADLQKLPPKERKAIERLAQHLKECVSLSEDELDKKLMRDGIDPRLYDHRYNPFVPPPPNAKEESKDSSQP